MLKKTFSVVLIALVVGSSGCCYSLLPESAFPRKFCGSGCPERYISDWHNHPPDCQDPCDCFGNFTGDRNGSKYWGPPSGIPAETVIYEGETTIEPAPRLARRRSLGR